MRAGRTNSSRSKAVRRLVTLVLALAALAALLPASQAAAATRLEVPEESPGPPFYARINAPLHVPHTDEWAAIVFYRNPACVPPAFNLLRFFAGPSAFACPLTVEGFEIWEDGPGQNPAPRMSHLRGTGSVPIWFVSWPQLQAAAADGVLTVAELQGLPSLVIGSGSPFREMLQPSQSNKKGKINIGARGTLADGRSFKFQFLAHGAEIKHVTISFR